MAAITSAHPSPADSDPPTPQPNTIRRQINAFLAAIPLVVNFFTIRG